MGIKDLMDDKEVTAPELMDNFKLRPEIARLIKVDKLLNIQPM